MKRNIHGHFADPRSTRDILEIKPHEYAMIISALQFRYQCTEREEEKTLIHSMLKDINQPYEGATYTTPSTKS